jgi:hypothetical protein
MKRMLYSIGSDGSVIRVAEGLLCPYCKRQLQPHDFDARSGGFICAGCGTDICTITPPEKAAS